MNNHGDIEHYWSMPEDALITDLNTSPEGLSDDESARRLATEGPNVIKARKKSNIGGLILDQFKSPIILILLFATIVSALLGGFNGCSDHSNHHFRQCCIECCPGVQSKFRH